MIWFVFLILFFYSQSVFDNNICWYLRFNIGSFDSRTWIRISNDQASIYNLDVSLLQDKYSNLSHNHLMLRETCSILALHCLYIDSRLGCVLPGEENLPQIASRRLSLDKHVLPTLLLHHHHPLVQRLHLATQPSSSHTTWSLHFVLLPLFRDVLFLLLTYRSGYPNPPIWPKYGVGQFGKYVCGLLALLAPTALVGGGGKWKFPGGKTSTRARGGAAQLADRFFGGRGCWELGGGWWVDGRVLRSSAQPTVTGSPGGGERRSTH